MRPAIQLYSVRDVDAPLPEILRMVAAAGFEGVEFAKRLHESDTDAVAAALAETGLEPVGAHVSLSDLETRNPEMLGQFDAIDCRRLVVPHVSPTLMRTDDRIRDLGERLDRTARRLDAEGFELSYHNQYHDFTRPIGSRVLSGVVNASQVPTAGEYAVELVHNRVADTVRRPGVQATKFGKLAAATDPSLLSFEIDVGWVAAGGYDIEDVLESLDHTVWALHMNDVALTDEGEYESVRPGTGIVGFEAAARAASRHDVEWLIYENDDPDDPVATIEHGADAVLPLAEGT